MLARGDLLLRIDQLSYWCYPSKVVDATDISQMTRNEKLRAMEALWTELSKEGDGVDSPSWHGEVLRETEARLAAGAEELLNWGTAKQALRKRFE
jgi:hypothetical protein